MCLKNLENLVNSIGVISDDDKASVLLRALMVSDLYCALAENVEVTTPDIAYGNFVRLARNENNNNRIQDDGVVSRRQAAYTADGPAPLRNTAPLKFCKHHGKC